jgi:HEAT repeat protein
MSGHNEMIPLVFRSLQPVSNLDTPLNIAELLENLNSLDEAIQINAIIQLSDQAQTQAGSDAIRENGGIPRLVSALVLSHSTLKMHVLNTLAYLAQHTLNKSTLNEAGAIPHLVALLGPEYEFEIRERAAGVICNLASGNEANQIALKQAGALAHLMALWHGGRLESKSIAAKAIYSLNITAIPELVALLKIDCPSLQNKCLNLLCAWLEEEDNKIRLQVLEAGGIPHLIPLLDSENPRVQFKAAAALYHLIEDISLTGQYSAASKAVANQDAIRKAGGVPKLLALLSSIDSSAQLEAAKVLDAISFNNPTNCTAIKLAGGIPKLVALLKSRDHDIVKSSIAILHNMASIREPSANLLEMLAFGALPELSRLRNTPGHFIELGKHNCGGRASQLCEWLGFLPQRVIATASAATQSSQAVFLSAKSELEKGPGIGSIFSWWR